MNINFDYGDKMKQFNKKTYTEAFSLFIDNAPENFPHIPSEEHSSQRLGGWFMNDEKGMYIGWVGHRGECQYASYVETTPETEFDERGRPVERFV